MVLSVLEKILSHWYQRLVDRGESVYARWTESNGPAIDREAVELLRDNPVHYFRNYPRVRADD
jgi:hypothetical protein